MESRITEVINKYKSTLPEEVISALKESENKLIAAETTINEKDATIAELREKLKEKELLRRLASSKEFGESSEQLLLNLFPEAEAIVNNIVEEEEEKKTIVNEHERKKRVVSSLPSDTPAIDIDHTQGAPEELDKDGIKYVRSEDKIIYKYSLIPAKLIVEKHHYPQYIALGVEEKKIVLYNHETDKSISSPSLMAKIIVNKMDDHQPLYRQSEMLKRYGCNISRQNMASWVIKYYDMLMPMADLIKKKVYSSPLVNKDETPCLILDLKGGDGKPSKNNFVTVSLGTEYDEQSRSLHTCLSYDVINGRSSEVLCEDFFLNNFSGFLMTDGLKQYKYNEEKHAVCLVHLRRRFVDVQRVDSKNKHAFTILAKIAEIYKIEKELRLQLKKGNITSSNFLTKRKSKVEPILDEMFTFCDSLVKGNYYTQSSIMGKALSYALSYKKNIYVYLNCLESSPDNSISERYIRPFTLSRKNWQFAQTVDGMDASMFFFTLIENAKLWSLPVLDYIEYVIEKGRECKSKEDFEALLPWNTDLSSFNSKELRLKAIADKERKEPYYFTGAARV